MSASIPSSTLLKFTTFGDLLRFLRRRAGITQVELSLAVGYSNAQISRLEQNLRLPDLTTIEARFVPALGLEQEAQAVTRLLELAANVRREDAPAAGLCPYKGLSFFDEADSDLFVGREALTSRLLSRLLESCSAHEPGGTRFLAIVGASGSGKSSLARAGLVPAVRWNAASSAWPIYILTPGAHPLENLALGLLEDGENTTSAARTVQDMACEARCLHLLCTASARRAGTSNVLLLVDQFEELFSLCRVEAERQAFIDNLLYAATDAGGPTVVLMTLRADFYSQCAAYPPLREALSRQQEYIGALSDEELRRAIEEPARKGRWDFEPGLVDLLIHDVGHEPGALPLLSHALLETWQRRRGQTLTLGGYASSGGVRGAIAETAQAVFADQLGPQQQAIARRVFLHLTELGDESGAGDTRRRATLEELIVRPDDADATRGVLAALADSRLITIAGDAVEVAHEALIREWPTLRGWLEDDREGLRLHRHLAQAAHEWAAAGRVQDALYRGARLGQAREWAASNSGEVSSLEQQFLEACSQAADREAAEVEAQRQHELAAAQRLAEAERARAEEQQRAAGRLTIRNRIISAVGALALLLAALAGVFGWQAQQNMQRADANLARARGLGLAIAAQVLLDHGGDPETAALLSLRSLQAAYSHEAETTLLTALSHISFRQAYRGHTGWIYSVAVSPDGKQLLTGSNDGTARLWNLLDGTEVRRFTDADAGIAAAAFSPDGQYIATGDNAGTLLIWQTATGEKLHTLKGHTGGLTSVEFSPDGRTVLSASGDTTARLWDADSGELIRVLAGHTAAVTQAVFAPDGRQVLTGSFDSTARLWDVQSGEVVRTFLSNNDATHLTGVWAVQFSPNGQTVLIARGDHTATLLSAGSGQEICVLRDAVRAITAASFSPDGKYVLGGGTDGVSGLWRAADCQQVPLASDAVLGAGGIKSVAFSRDGRYFVTGGFDDTARLWSTPESGDLRVFSTGTQGSGAAVTSVAFSPNGRYVLAGSQDGFARIWDMASGAKVRTLAGHAGAVNGVAFSVDGRVALTGGDDNTVRVWDAATGRQLLKIDSGVKKVTGVAFSLDGRQIFATGAGDMAPDDPPFAMSTRVWDVSSGALVHAFDFGFLSSDGTGLKPGIAVSADGQRVLVRNLTHGALLFDDSSGEGACDLPGASGEVLSVALSADGKYALTGSSDRIVRVWDVRTCSQVRTLTAGSAVLSVAFSPDGRFMATGEENNTAHLWNVKDGTQVRQLTAHTGAVEAVAFSPDSRYVLTASRDGTIRVWDTDYRDTVRFACSVLWRDLNEEERLQYGVAGDSATCPQP